MMDDMETLHPGCMVASVTYQERLFDAEMRQMNVDYLMRTRQRFSDWLNEIVVKNPPEMEADLDALADHLTIIVEGAIIYAKALRDPGMMGRQTRLFRNHIKLLFGA
jgi:hypothetical protein